MPAQQPSDKNARWGKWKVSDLRGNQQWTIRHTIEKPNGDISGSFSIDGSILGTALRQLYRYE